MWDLKNTILLFDLDGTLLHTAPTFVVICNRILAQKGYAPVTLDVIADSISYGVKAMMRASFGHYNYVLTEAEIEETSALFFELYTQDLFTDTESYQGLEAVLSHLSNQGVKMAVVTNKTQEYADRLIDHFGWRTYFPVVKGPSEGAKKPSPNHIYVTLSEMGLPKNTPCILVGDSPVDWETAKNTGIPFIFHESGYKDQMVIETPFAFSSYSEFLRVLETCLTIQS